MYHQSQFTNSFKNANQFYLGSENHELSHLNNNIERNEEDHVLTSSLSGVEDEDDLCENEAAFANLENAVDATESNSNDRKKSIH